MVKRAALLRFIAVVLCSCRGHATEMTADLEEFRKELIAALEVPDAVAVIRDLFAFLAKPLDELDSTAAEGLAGLAAPLLSDKIGAMDDNSHRSLQAVEATQTQEKGEKSGVAEEMVEDNVSVVEETVEDNETRARIPRKKRNRDASPETTADAVSPGDGALSEGVADAARPTRARRAKADRIVKDDEVSEEKQGTKKGEETNSATDDNTPEVGGIKENVTEVTPEEGASVEKDDTRKKPDRTLNAEARAKAKQSRRSKNAAGEPAASQNALRPAATNDRTEDEELPDPADLENVEPLIEAETEMQGKSLRQ